MFVPLEAAFGKLDILLPVATNFGRRVKKLGYIENRSIKSKRIMERFCLMINVYSYLSQWIKAVLSVLLYPALI